MEIAHLLNCGKRVRTYRDIVLALCATCRVPARQRVAEGDRRTANAACAVMRRVARAIRCPRCRRDALRGWRYCINLLRVAARGELRMTWNGEVIGEAY